jgi:hypothetical protein
VSQNQSQEQDAGNKTDAERWLPAVGWEGLYEVSSEGRVRFAAARTQPGRRRAAGDLVSVQRGKRCEFVTLTRGAGANRKGQRSLSVAKLVAEAFLGPAPDPKCIVRREALDSYAARNLSWGRGSRGRNHPALRSTMVAT